MHSVPGNVGKREVFLDGMPNRSFRKAESFTKYLKFRIFANDVKYARISNFNTQVDALL